MANELRETSPRKPPPGWALLLFVVALALVPTLVTHTTGDYIQPAFLRGAGDNPAPAIVALAHGDVSRFAAVQPLMGLSSLLVRVPVVGASAALGANWMVQYRLGTFVCLIALALLAFAITRRRPRLSVAAPAALLLLVGPATLSAVRLGHPEELLTCALATGAVLLARGERAIAAGVCLGLAVATKQWAVIAVAPVLIALQTRRVVAGCIAGTTAALLMAPGPVLDWHAYLAASRTVGGTHFVNRLSGWWALSVHADVPAPVRALPWGLVRTVALFGPVALISCVALGLSIGRRRGRGDGLALLAVLALVRCLADSGPLEYYYAPLVTALVAWDVVVMRRPPITAAVATAALLLTFGPGLSAAATVINGSLLAGALLLVVALRQHPRSHAAPGRRAGVAVLSG